MAQQIKSKTAKAADDSLVKPPITNAQPNYYDTQVMFAGYPGSKTASGSLRRKGRPVDPILDDLDEIDEPADISSLLPFEPDQD
ncbi:MAG: hypothetical protein WCC58_03080 [Burkholderiales bacterium]